MRKRFWRSLWVCAVVAVAVTVAALAARSQAARSPNAARAETPKVAVILSVGLKDTGYGRSALGGINRVKAQLGNQVDTADLVKPADFASAMSDFASRGYPLVILDGVEFQDAAKQVAPQFPKTTFVVVNGFLAAEPNLAAVNFEWEQAGFLGGIVAGLATKSNKLGNIGGVKIPPIQGLFYGFAQGAKQTNKKAKVTVSWVGTFTDPGKAKQVALAQISRGVDVIWAIADTGNTGIFQAVTEKNKKVIGYGVDESNLAPKNTLTTTIVKYGTVIFNVVKEFNEGQFKPTVEVVGFKDKVFDLAPIRGLTKAQVATALRLAKQAKAGKVPIKKLPVK
jgi:basic membrane protein A